MSSKTHCLLQRRRCIRRLIQTTLVSWFWVASWLVPDQVMAGQLALRGSLMQGGLLIGRVTPGSTITVEGEPIRVSYDGHFLVGFHRDAPALTTIRATYPDGGMERRTLEVAQRSYRVQRIDGLPSRKVTPDSADLERIRAEAALVRKARKHDAARTDFLTGFEWPVRGPITGVYGSRRILNGQPRQPHYGIDIAAPAGSPVRAPADGVVMLAHPDMFFSGATLVVDHGHGLSSSFLHLSEILVTDGESVSRGQAIARVGATGRVTGAHLDWRINLFEKRLDPQLLAGPMPGDRVSPSR
jgi:murein DD-endopeptidase MepM/ murein hydrolase activator NlpD